MIENIKHKALKNYWTKGRTIGFDELWVTKLRRIMLALENANVPQDLNVPGWQFSKIIRSQPSPTYRVRLAPNWQVTFQWEGRNPVAINIEEYRQ